jgi:YHS domain-containing protein
MANDLFGLPSKYDAAQVKYDIHGYYFASVQKCLQHFDRQRFNCASVS